MGHGTMTPETRYATARRLMRDAEKRAERLEADLSRVRGEFDAMEDRAKVAERSRDAAITDRNDALRDASAAPYLSDMVNESARALEAITGPEDPALGVESHDDSEE